MVRLTESEAKRQIVEFIREPIESEVTLGYLYGKYGPNAYIDIDWWYDECTVYICASREESDEEYTRRTEKLLERKRKAAERQAKLKAEKEAKERAEYERLRKKFEGK